MDAFKLESVLRVGDILTSGSVLLALSGFLYTWRKDRRLRTKEYADKVRSAASTALAKIDRWESLFLSVVDKARPLFVEIHGLAAKPEADKGACWQEFHKQMTAVRTSIAKQSSDEQIEIAYAPLFAHRADIYDRFRSAIKNIKETEEAFFRQLWVESNNAIFDLPSELQFPSPLLHDKLLDICSYLQKKELASILDEIRSFLKGIVASSDEQLMSRVIEPRSPSTAPHSAPSRPLQG